MESSLIVAVFAGLILAYTRLIYMPKKKTGKLYKELEDAKNETVNEKKESAIDEAKEDHANAISDSVTEWVKNWLRSSKRS